MKTIAQVKAERSKAEAEWSTFKRTWLNGFMSGLCVAALIVLVISQLVIGQ